MIVVTPTLTNPFLVQSSMVSNSLIIFSFSSRNRRRRSLSAKEAFEGLQDQEEEMETNKCEQYKSNRDENGSQFSPVALHVKLLRLLLSLCLGFFPLSIRFFIIHHPHSPPHSNSCALYPVSFPLLYMGFDFLSLLLLTLASRAREILISYTPTTNETYLGETEQYS